MLIAVIAFVLALCLQASAVPTPPRDVQEFVGLEQAINEFRKGNGRLPAEEDWFHCVEQYIGPDLLETGLDPSRFRYRLRSGTDSGYALECCGRDGRFDTEDDVDAKYVSKLLKSTDAAGRAMAAAPERHRAGRRRKIVVGIVAGVALLAVMAACLRLARKRKPQQSGAANSGSAGASPE